MTRVANRAFAHAITMSTTDPEWTARRVSATSPVAAETPYFAFVRIDDGDTPRFGYIVGRSTWVERGHPVAEGLLYEVAGSLRGEPAGFPRNGRRFRELSEVMVANDEALFDRLRAGFA
jgi:hypothetical protein